MAEDLEKTYSREQQRMGDERELKEPTTPYSLVRSLTQGMSTSFEHLPLLMFQQRKVLTVREYGLTKKMLTLN